MYKTTHRYSFAFLPVLFFFLCSLAHAQSKSVKEALSNADRLHLQKKYEECRTLYLQHMAYLSPQQQLNLGSACVGTSKEKPERLTEGMNWFEKAAQAGNTEAMNTLSYCYGKGIGVSKDSVQELNWLSKSADNGNADALLVLGYRYEKGSGVAANRKKAEELYTMAANKGNAQAAYNLSGMDAFERVTSSTLYWLTKSAKSDYLPAMLKLGEIYENGKGLGRKDPDEAVRWYKKIAGIEGFTSAHSQAIDRKRAIGRVEPSTDITIVKPLLNKLLGGAANNYGGLMGEEKEPLERDRYEGLISTSTYYTCTVDLGFKNALVRKEIVQAQDMGEYEIKAGTHYSYSADIVHSVSEETARRVFEKWVTVLKAIIPVWQSSRNDENRLRPSFTIGGNMTNGKTVNITLSVYGYNPENVSIHVSNR